MKERALTFTGPGCSLVGIVTEPTQQHPARRRVAVLFYNAFVVPRIGPHRFNVVLARRVAARGFLACRFDLSGIGDSPPRSDDLPMERGAPIEFHTVMDELAERFQVDRFILIGVCIGGNAALQAAIGERRVVAAALVNTQAFTQFAIDYQEIRRRGAASYYLGRALFDPKRWARFLTGRSDYHAILASVLGRLRRRLVGSSESDQRFRRIPQRIRSATDRGVDLLFVHTEGDRGVDHLRLLLDAEPGFLDTNPRARHVLLPPADHLLTPSWAREEAFALLEEWLEGLDLALPEAPPEELAEEDVTGSVGRVERFSWWRI